MFDVWRNNKIMTVKGFCNYYVKFQILEWKT